MPLLAKKPGSCSFQSICLRQPKKNINYTIAIGGNGMGQTKSMTGTPSHRFSMIHQSRQWRCAIAMARANCWAWASVTSVRFAEHGLFLFRSGSGPPQPGHLLRHLGNRMGQAKTGCLYYYLGYWVAGCGAMEYKATFRPCELLGTDGLWRPSKPNGSNRVRFSGRNSPQQWQPKIYRGNAYPAPPANLAALCAAAPAPQRSKRKTTPAAPSRSTATAENIFGDLQAAATAAAAP